MRYWSECAIVSVLGERKTALSRVRLLLALCLLSLMSVGCSRQQQAAVSGPEAQTALSVLVSEDLRQPFDAMRTNLLQKHPRISLDVTVAPGAELRKRVVAGELDGVLITVGPAEVTVLDQADRLAAGSQVILADLHLAVIAQAGNPLSLSNIQDLADPMVGSIVVGDKASGSIGKEAKRALQKAELWERIKDRTRQIPLEELVREVAAGRADAAIVGRHQASGDDIALVCAVDTQLHREMWVLAVRTTGLPEGPRVREWTEFLRSSQAREPLLAVGLTKHQEEVASGKEVSLFWFCGAGLRKPAEECIKAFYAKTAIRIYPTYTGSGCLLAQIAIGEMGDLYMPGEDFYVLQAQERGFITEYRIVSYFVPVIMVQKGNPKRITGLTGLLKPGLRVGMGEPDACAIGNFTLKILKAKGIAIEDFRKNVVAEFVTAPELGNAIKLGSVDAVVQWDAVASWYLDDAEVIPFRVDDKTVSPIPLGILKFSKHPQEARQFLEFVAGEAGQAIFRRHGHTTDPAHPVFPVEGATAS